MFKCKVFSNFPVHLHTEGIGAFKNTFETSSALKNNITDFKILKLMVRTKLRSLVIFFQITDYPISNSFLGRWISFHIKYIRLRECRLQRTKTQHKEKSPNILTSSHLHKKIKSYWQSLGCK